MNNKLKETAITLIALVVTIIILLILAGVTIGFAMNGTGLFNKAKLATDEYNNKVAEENFELGQAENLIDIQSNRDTVISQQQLNQLLYPNKSMNLTNSITGFSDTTAAQSYTIPKTGWLYVYGYRNAGGGLLHLTLNSLNVYEVNSAAANNGSTGYFPVKEGDILTKTQSHTGFSFTAILNYYE